MLTSVHAFASDPARGIFILIFLVIVTAGSLLLFALKLEKIENKKNIYLFSREGGLLLNNIFLCASAATILLGTIWPLVIEVITGQDISVGAPYFKIVFLPLIFPAIFLSGVSINLNWKITNIEYIYSRLWILMVVFIFLVSIYYFVFLSRDPVLQAILNQHLIFWVCRVILRHRKESLLTFEVYFENHRQFVLF